VKDPRDIIIRPVVSEKSYSLLDQNVYTFLVHPDASKPEIHDAIQAIFNKRVVGVNTVNRKGKTQRTRKSNRRGHKAATKRAYVTLAPGERIELFES
jgi:large subunit ribosomal protein L23